MKLKWFVSGVVIAGLLQTAALAKIIYDRAMLIENGTEVTLQSGMVDPRDLFRGHYVVLDLTIQRLQASDVTTDGKFKYNQDIWLSLKKGEDEFWVAKTLYAAPPVTDDPIIKGTYQSTSNATNQPQQNIRLRFPINRFYAEKTRAKELEKIRNDRNLGVVVALDGKGGAVIKGISIESELIYDEPLW